MRQVAHQTFFEPARFAGSRDPDLAHLILAIGRAITPPVVHMRSSFQPMRVIVVQPDLVTTINRAAEWGCETPQLLPALHAQQATPNEQSQWRQRIVQGEILSDDTGQLYEKIGRQIRPVHQLASGPSGELVEMIPAERSNLRVISPSPRSVDASERSTSVPARFVPGQLVKDEGNNAGHRKLFNDPGQWRVVNWGEFKEILAPQLAHPDRLRDSYRLPCYVQVIESLRDVTIGDLAKEFSTANGRPKPLYFLTDEIAGKLELTSLLPQTQPKRSGPRDPNVLLAHERVFGLLVANDPTADVSLKKEKQQSVPAQKSTAAESKNPTDARKTSIPNNFVKEWEFKLSRDEVMYDITRPTFFSKVFKHFSRLRIFRQQKELQKWQVMLTGKTADEQLWGVRPPKDMLVHSFIREWAKKTLGLAGYESEKMIHEWEVFWRRKGAR